MALISIVDYNRHEQNAVMGMPLNLIGAFQPVYFQGSGYTTHIEDEQQLSKFLDANHDFRFEPYISQLLGGITEAEFTLLQKLTSVVSEFSESRFGYKSVARSNIAFGLNILRHIKYIFGEERPAIFEVGPGAGYLGAMLILEGYPYAATDITQSLYLYQNALWDHVTGGQLVELAARAPDDLEFPAPTPGNPVHIPWWKFSRLNPGDTPSFQVVTCNNCLSEMHPQAFSFTLNILQGFDQDSNGPTFVFSGLSDSRYTSEGTMVAKFYQMGQTFVQHDDKISVVAPRSQYEYLDLPNPKSRLVRGMWRAIRSMLGLNPLSPWRQPFHPYVVTRHKYSSKTHPHSIAIRDGRESLSRSINVDQISDFHREILGTEAPLTPNEEFLQAAGIQSF